jgi:hypothetical protein
VSISDAWGFLDSAWDIVVGIAELVCEKFNLVRWLTNGIIDDSVSSRSRHSLFSSSWDKVVFIDVPISYRLVDDSARHGILERAKITAKDSGVYSLANIDIHDLSLRDAKIWKCQLDLVYLWLADCLDLTFSYSISEEDDSLGISIVVLLECLTGLCHTLAQGVNSFLTKFILDYTCWPVLSSSRIHWSSKSKDWFLSKSSRVEDIHTTYHSWLIRQRKTINSPRNSSNLSIDLNKNLVYNRSKILAFRDSVS